MCLLQEQPPAIFSPSSLESAVTSAYLFSRFSFYKDNWGPRESYKPRLQLSQLCDTEIYLTKTIIFFKIMFMLGENTSNTVKKQKNSNSTKITSQESTTITILLNVLQTHCNPEFSCIAETCPGMAETHTAPILVNYNEYRRGLAYFLW